jgi:hypothetical protein
MKEHTDLEEAQRSMLQHREGMKAANLAGLLKPYGTANAWRRNWNGPTTRKRRGARADGRRLRSLRFDYPRLARPTVRTAAKLTEEG